MVEILGWHHSPGLRQRRSDVRSKQSFVDNRDDTRGNRLWLRTSNDPLSRMRSTLVLEGIDLFRDVQTLVYGAQLSELQISI
jgi:hypothetical protein